MSDIFEFIEEFLDCCLLGYDNLLVGLQDGEAKMVGAESFICVIKLSDKLFDDALAEFFVRGEVKIVVCADFDNHTVFVLAKGEDARLVFALLEADLEESITKLLVPTISGVHKTVDSCQQEP